MKNKNDIIELIDGIDFTQKICEEIVAVINERTTLYLKEKQYYLLENIAVNLCHFYEAVEDIFTRIARIVDGRLPSSRNFHQALLE